MLNLAAQNWAIHPDNLHGILEIASRGDLQTRLRDFAPSMDRVRQSHLECLMARGGDLLSNTRSVVVRDGVAVLHITGAIFRHGGFLADLFGWESLESMARGFARAASDPAIKAIMLNISSPGGQLGGIAEFQSMIREASKSKPVVAYVGGMAASAGYWLASGAQRIIINRTALLGSIGIVSTLRDTSAADAARGIKNYEIVSSQSPRKNPNPATESGMADLQALVDRLGVEMIACIAEARGTTPEKVNANFGKGGLLVGSDAIAAGMADELGSFESVMSRLSKGDTFPSRSALSHAPAVSVSSVTSCAAATVPTVTMSQRKEAPAMTAKQHLENLEKFSETLEARAKAEWNQDARIRGEFRDNFGAYLAWKRVSEAKEVKAMKGDFIRNIVGAASIDDGTLETKAKADWRSDPKLRAEFRDNFGTYFAWLKADQANKVKTLKKELRS